MKMVRPSPSAPAGRGCGRGQYSHAQLFCGAVMTKCPRLGGFQWQTLILTVLEMEDQDRVSTIVGSGENLPLDCRQPASAVSSRGRWGVGAPWDPFYKELIAFKRAPPSWHHQSPEAHLLVPWVRFQHTNSGRTQTFSPWQPHTGSRIWPTRLTPRDQRRGKDRKKWEKDLKWPANKGVTGFLNSDFLLSLISNVLQWY